MIPQKDSRALRLLLALSFALLFSSAESERALAQPNDHDPTEVIIQLGRDLYQLAELTGGSEEEWTVLEANAAAKMRTAISNRRGDGSAIDANNQKALNLAARKGFGFLVDILLEDEVFRSLVNETDEGGLTPYDHATLAVPLTLTACHPEIENPFVLIPFLVQTPYYQNRDPFAGIRQRLIAAGADTDMRRAKKHWLAVCSNENSATRSEVENTEDLYLSLQKFALQARNRQALHAVQKKIDSLNRLIDILPEKQRPKPEEIEKMIDGFYSGAGIERPK